MEINTVRETDVRVDALAALVSRVPDTVKGDVLLAVIDAVGSGSRERMRVAVEAAQARHTNSVVKRSPWSYVARSQMFVGGIHEIYVYMPSSLSPWQLLKRE